MKTLFFLAVVFFTTFFSKAETPDRPAPYSVSYEADSTVGSNEGKVTFICYQFEVDGLTEHTLRYGLKGSSQKAQLDSGKSQFSLPVSPGKYVFQFYYTFEFKEIDTDSIEVKPGMATLIYLTFDLSWREELMRKPVIYLYPETQTSVSVSVKPTGKLSFTYPGSTASWNTIAQPNGDLTINRKVYRYLFWESQQQPISFFTSGKQQEGFLISKGQTIAFLEEKLTSMGLNDAEKTDFITFWGPQLAAHEQCILRFVINEQCDQFAELSIEPKPDHVNRVYLIWQPVFSNEASGLLPQELPVLNRDGFDVLEWGGSEIPSVTTVRSED